MGKIILPYKSLSVYLRSPFGCNIASKVMFPPKVLCAMRHWLLSPRYHLKKRTKSKRIRKIFISGLSFFASSCFDSGGDILMLVPHERL